MVELGVYEERDNKNNLKNKGKYLVGWNKNMVNGKYTVILDCKIN